MTDTFIPLSIPHLAGNEWAYVKKCLDTGWVSSVGSFVTEFEKSVATFTGSPFAVATVNGTAALHIALILSGVKAGDEVIVPTLTFIAPVNAVTYCGARPVFIDCDEFMNLDAAKVVRFCEEECSFDGNNLINKKTGAKIKAVIPVHVFGNPAVLEPLLALREKFGLKIIEDATESLGSTYSTGPLAGKHTGTLGDFGCFSFNGNKIITTGGGGMLVTDKKENAQAAKHLTTQAKSDDLYFEHDVVGYNYRLTNVAAAIGVAQMEQLKGFIATRRANFKKYDEALSGLSQMRLLKEPSYAHSNYWYYALIVDPDGQKSRRDELLSVFKKAQIESRPVWHLNHLQKPYINDTAYHIEKAPWFLERVLNLPCSASITDEQIGRVVEVMKNF